MRAAYGDPKVRKTGRDVVLWEHQDAVDAVDKLGSARRWFIASLAAIVIAVGLTWYWPAKAASLVRADFGNERVCGTLVRADRQAIVIKEDGTEKQRPITDLESLAVVAACP